MSVFTDEERAYLGTQRLARLATASSDGQPDVAAVGFGLDGDTIVSGGIDITRTVRYRHLRTNPVATIVIDDLQSVDPWRPRGLKVRGRAELEQRDGRALVRIHPETIWSWGLNQGRSTRFGPIEKRSVSQR